MEKVLIIVRAIPGAGKNTFADLITKNVCCADDYFMDNGEYVWNPKDLGRAHMWCQNKCRKFMESGISPVVVANTSVTTKELKPYYKLAEEFGYKVFSVIVENRHGGVNVHGVSQETIDKMKERFNIQL